MPTLTVTELAATMEQLQAQMAEIARQIVVLGNRDAGEHGPNGAAAVGAQPAATRAVVSEPPKGLAVAEITDEEVWAISAAIGAYLGVRAHIRQIRLVSTTAWAQQGRVSIQASHTLQG